MSHAFVFVPVSPSSYILLTSFSPLFTHTLTTYSPISFSTGPLIHLQILNQHLVIIDSYPVAIDILEKRSGIYSSRAPIPMLRLMGGWDTFQFAFIPYGERVIRGSLGSDPLRLFPSLLLCSALPIWFRNPTSNATFSLLSSHR
jgi:hypothetical protein